MPKPSTKSSAKKTKSSNRLLTNVIPAKAGIQKCLKLLDPDLRRDDKKCLCQQTANNGWLTGQFKIVNPAGLHARAAASFVTLAKQFSGEIEIGKEGQFVNGKSMLGVLMLGAQKGEMVAVKVKGLQAQEAITQLGQLIEAGFNE